ncbi:MAG: hypothetical protein Q8J90_03235 [Gallionella sp.]|nr:hypothetical protein [Gallionella sp.]
MRLSKITTRTGDNGSTGLANGTRLGKDHARIVALGTHHEAAPLNALPYLNRLSDLLFVLCRVINHAQAAQETLWQRSG